MKDFQLQRLGLIMEPEPGNTLEVEGVLNPAAVRGPDGQLYLFPRLVAKGNYSRIGIARVKFSDTGEPSGVERLGIALEPETEYELRPDGSGGCEDPRITYIEPLQRYVMTYTALSSRGPRIALAISKDLFHWERMGLAIFMPYEGVEFNDVDNKDSLLFPVAIPDPNGQLSVGVLYSSRYRWRRTPQRSVESESESCANAWSAAWTADPQLHSWSCGGYSTAESKRRCNHYGADTTENRSAS